MRSGKSEVSFPATPCDRQRELLLKWASHDNYVAGCLLREEYPTWKSDETLFAVQNEAWKNHRSLMDHAKYCPQCQVFAVPVPYLTAEGLAALKAKD